MNGFSLKENGEVRYYFCDGFKAKHGFFTRSGGVSTLPHLASLNVGKGLGDGDGNVEENLGIISLALGFERRNLVYAKQIHSAKVLTVSEVPSEIPECDGFVTKEKGIALLIKTADCTPILFEDSEAGIIGAVHAGWRGTASGIAPECVRKMLLLGARAERIKAAIGPCIRQCCYEVDSQFYDAIEEKLGKDICDRFVKKDGEGDRFHADLAGMNRELLLRSGLKEENVFISPLCTCCDTDSFFSHRGMNGKRGVQASVIVNQYEGTL